MDTDNSSYEQVELSIILISYNTEEITRNCIESIYTSLSAEKNLSFELIVLDNASKDNSVAMLKSIAQQYPTMKVIESHENLGFSKGNNKALEQSKGKYILFINSDIIVHDDAIAKLLAYYKSDETHIHFAGGKLYNQDGTPQPSCGPFYTPIVVFGALFLRGDYWGLTRYSPDTPRQVDWVSGACILTKKEYLDALHGFDTDIFMYMEEIDLLYRANKKGYHTYFYPDAHFTHLGSASSGGKTFPILQVFNGFIYFYKKHYTTRDLSILKFMLQLKAATALLIGKMTGNTYLKQTYEKAYHIASMAR